MGSAATPTRANRAITGDVRDDVTALQRRGADQAALACRLTCLLARGVQLAHRAPCRGGGGLPRHWQDGRGRLGGLPSWRLRCTMGQAVLTILPHCVWRARQVRPEVAGHA